MGHSWANTDHPGNQPHPLYYCDENLVQSPRQRQGFCLGKSRRKVWGGFCAQRAEV